MGIYDFLKGLPEPLEPDDESPMTVYYSPQVNKFFTVKLNHDDGVICSGFCDFYGDAQTNVQRQMLSAKFMSKCIKVTAIDQFPYAEISPSTGSWKVKGT